MTKKVRTILKYVGLFSIVFFTIISCEKEIEDIGVDLIENKKFKTGDFVTEVLSETENVEKVPANNLGQYLLGLYSDSEFGVLKGSVVSQLLLPTIGTAYDYGDNAAIDSVLLFIPYQSTRIENAADGKPLFELDSIFGNTDNEFKFGVYELETFLNTLDPEDPSKNMIYYSDKVFEKSDTPFYLDDFKVNANDTVAYIKRYMPDGITVYDIDTIKESATNPSPTIKLPLNESMIQEIFVDNASGTEFSSLEAFLHYFRGFYLEATELNTNKSHLLSLALGARMVIYYSNDQDEASGVDMNGNGVSGEQDVRISESYIFYFGTNKSNVLDRDYSESMQSGPNRLYVQGAAGSIATIDLFADMDLPELQENQYLINGANLTFYIDRNASSDIIPQQLFIYNHQENEQILDVMTGGINEIRGYLERDVDGNPEKYIFRIVDYVSEVLKASDPENLVTLGIKVYNPTDAPSSVLDTIVSDYNWMPHGVVLYDQSESAGDKRVKLDIYYSQSKEN